MIVGYVVLDGFDLGVGVLHLFLVRTEAERKATLASIGPVWDGNEVWLLAGGGTLYFAFPLLYASAFSGFYLPLMIVLWLLILRGISLELRNHVDVGVWRSLLDGVFGLVKRAADHLLRCGAGQRAARRSFTGRRLLLPAIVDQLAARRASGDSGLVHGDRRPGGVGRAHNARGSVAHHQDLERTWSVAPTANRDTALAGAGGAHGGQPYRHHRRAARQPEQLFQLSVHLCCARGRGCVAGRRLALESQRAAGESFPLLLPVSVLHAGRGMLGTLPHAAAGDHRRGSRHHTRAALSPDRTHWPSGWFGGSSE